MSRIDEFSPFFQRMLDQPEETVEALRENAAIFERDFVAVEAERPVDQTILPDRRALAFALFDRRGEALECPGSPPLIRSSSLQDLRQYADSRSGDGRLLCIPRAGSPPFLGFWAPYAETRGWNLPASIRDAGGTLDAGFIAVFAGLADQPLASAAGAFGLTASQQRVVSAVIAAGGVKPAAERLGISYAAAREHMAAAARRMQAQNTPAVVRAIVAAAFGVLPGEVDSSLLLADALPITERQARLALLISCGASRKEAASALNTSEAVVKKELVALYAALGVQTATELSRLITEMQALRLFARSIDNPPGFLDPAIEPSRFAIRPDGRGVIAWSDYGPSSGRPVLVVHSNWCCRAVPLPLLRELQRRGWRPIAIDRPGFGSTSIGASRREDPFTQAGEDVIQILDGLRIARIPIVARCGAQFVHAFASRWPERVGATVLVSPVPAAVEDTKRSGAVAGFKEAFMRSPRLVEMLWRLLSSQMSFGRVEAMMQRLTRGSPTDEALACDPQFIRDRFRALRPFTCGGYIGGVLEEFVISHGGWRFDPLVVPSATILHGSEDTHSSLRDVARYWARLLPGVPVESVEGGGRFMTSSHPSLIVDRLEGLVRSAGNVAVKAGGDGGIRTLGTGFSSTAV